MPRIFRHPIVRGAASIGLVIGALTLAAGNWCLVTLGEQLIRTDPAVPTALVVVLSGSYPDRVLEGIDAFREYGAAQLILTREPPLPGGDALRARGVTVTEADELNRSAAVQLGVPAQAIVVLPPPLSSTLAEARVVVDFARSNAIRSFTVVTSKIHSRRAAWIFRAVCAADCAVHMRPSRYDPFNSLDWWQHRGLVRRVVIEYGKLVYFGLVDQWRV